MAYMGVELLQTSPAPVIKNDAFKPFNQIAVSVSGGGFRSAAYALGCQSYLE